MADSEDDFHDEKGLRKEEEEGEGKLIDWVMSLLSK